MIKKIELTNFMSHAHSVIEPGIVTSIIGQNGAGKSNIWLATNIALTNDDFPETLVRRGETSASIKVEFPDGRSIIRERNGSSQRVTLHTPGEEDVVFNTVRDITATVQKFTGFSDIALDNKAVENLQLVPLGANPYFMFAGISPETILRRFTRLMAGGSIEDAKKGIASDIYQQKQRLNLQKENLEKMVVPFDEERLNQVDAMNEAFKAKSRKRAELTTKYDTLTRVQTRFLTNSVNAGLLHSSIQRFDGLPRMQERLNKRSGLMIKMTLLGEIKNGLFQKYQLEKELEVQLTEAQKELAQYKLCECKQCGKLCIK